MTLSARMASARRSGTGGVPCDASIASSLSNDALKLAVKDRVGAESSSSKDDDAATPASFKDADADTDAMLCDMIVRMRGSSKKKSNRCKLLSFSPRLVMATTFIYADDECAKARHDGLICVACNQPLVEPQAHIPCLTMACKACFAQVTHCPYCESGLRPCDMTVVVRLITARLDALRVHCPTCNALVSRGELAAHVADCPHPCARGCGAHVKPADSDAHDAVCGAHEETCTAFGCHAAVRRSELGAHRDHCLMVKVEPALREMQAVATERVWREIAELSVRITQLESRVSRKRSRPPAKQLAGEPAQKRARTSQAQQPPLASLSILHEKRQNQQLLQQLSTDTDS